MSKIETKANDSRQSVDLKWKLRKGLEENVAFKEDGTMEVGKGLDVDGPLTLNAPEDLAFKTGSLDFSKLKNQHTVRYYAVLGGETSAPTGYISIAFTCNSPSGLEIDSPQDLFMVFGGQDIAVAGSFYFNGREYFPTYIHLGASINDSAIYGSTAEYYGSLEPVALSHWPNSLKIEDTVFNPD